MLRVIFENSLKIAEALPIYYMAGKITNVCTAVQIN